MFCCVALQLMAALCTKLNLKEESFSKNQVDFLIGNKQLTDHSCILQKK